MLCFLQVLTYLIPSLVSKMEEAIRVATMVIVLVEASNVIY